MRLMNCVWRSSAAIVTIWAASFAQTRVDLGRQGRNVDFRSAASTKPMRTGPVLPDTCASGDLFLKVNGSVDGSLYICIATDHWAQQTGAIRVENNGSPAGVRDATNFLSGPGVLTSTVDDGSKISVEHAVNTAVVQTRGESQSGRALLCRSLETSGSEYTCAMEPTLTGYAEGMVLHWIPGCAPSGAATLNIDTLGARPIKTADGTSDLSEGAIAQNRLYEMWYDGQSFRMLQAPEPAAPSSVIPMSESLLKGDGAGNAIPAIPGADFIASLAAGAGVHVACPAGNCEISATNVAHTTELLKGDGAGGAVALESQSGRKALMSPADGSSGPMMPRAITIADLPTSVPLCTATTVTYTDAMFQGNSSMVSAPVRSLPADSEIVSLRITPIQAFAGPGITDVKLRLGWSGVTASYAPDFDVDDPPSATNFWPDAGAGAGTSAAHDVIATVTAVGAAFGSGSASNLTAGQARISICARTLPVAP